MIDTKKLKKINHSKISDYIADKELLSRLKKTQEPIFLHSKVNRKKEFSNPVLDFELAFQKCKRVGFFKK